MTVARDFYKKTSAAKKRNEHGQFVFFRKRRNIGSSPESRVLTGGA